MGAIGIIVPTVDDALEARDAARFSRFPPFGRRSSGGGSFGQVWPGVNYRETINDNMLVTVMIETLEGVANVEEIAATHGVDAIILGNNDLVSFSGWSQNDPRYQDAIIKVHNAALKYGKYYGNAGSQYLNGYTVTAGTRMVQNGPARDGWAPPRGGRGAAGAAPAAGRGRGENLPEPDAEPVLGLPGGAQPGRRRPAAEASNLRQWRFLLQPGKEAGRIVVGLTEGDARQWSIHLEVRRERKAAFSGEIATFVLVFAFRRTGRRARAECADPGDVAQRRERFAHQHHVSFGNSGVQRALLIDCANTGLKTACCGEIGVDGDDA